MKKKITAILLIILIFATLAYARSMRSSGVLAATASVTTSEGFLHKVIIRPDRASTSNFNIYDFGAVTGGYTTTEKEVVPTFTCTTTESTAFYIQMDIPRVPFRDGLYAVISSTGEMIIFYEQ
jgi:high-affinity nickel permease